jgi:hypothetical protein
LSSRQWLFTIIVFGIFKSIKADAINVTCLYDEIEKLSPLSSRLNSKLTLSFDGDEQGIVIQLW